MYTKVFFNDTATTEIYTLSLHDALPIWWPEARVEATTVVVGDLPPARGLVAVVTAGTSDGAVAAEAATPVRVFGADVVRGGDVGVAGLHRVLDARPVLQDAHILIVLAGGGGGGEENS